jgi:peroxiredoxin
MAAWGRDEKGIGKIRFLGDGSGDFAAKLGLDLDLTGFGMGRRMQRCAMLVEDGVVKQLFVEKGGTFEVSSAEHMLKHL